MDNAIDDYKPLNFYFLDEEVMVAEIEENDIKSDRISQVTSVGD
jgi:hypothetical protein